MTEQVRSRAEKIARLLRVRIHALDPEQADNKKWLDSVCAGDADLLVGELADFRREVLREAAQRFAGRKMYCGFDEEIAAELERLSEGGE